MLRSRLISFAPKERRFVQRQKTSLSTLSFSLLVPKMCGKWLSLPSPFSLHPVVITFFLLSTHFSLHLLPPFFPRRKEEEGGLQTIADSFVSNQLSLSLSHGQNRLSLPRERKLSFPPAKKRLFFAEEAPLVLSPLLIANYLLCSGQFGWERERERKEGEARRSTKRKGGREKNSVFKED